MHIDIHLNGSWHLCAGITARDESRTSRLDGLTLRYDVDYAGRHLLATDYRALSVRIAVDLAVHPFTEWPSFLIDLLPQGAARKRLQRGSETGLSEWQLLERGAINPVGNLRVRSIAPKAPHAYPGFELDEMIARGDTFIDFAYQAGAAIAGATDTQGEAPKFWVIQDDQGRWHPDDGYVGAGARRFALLKFPVPEAGRQATDILRHEAAYQRVAARLGLRVTPDLPEFIDGALLVPRFDRRRQGSSEIRLGVESLYSIAGVVDAARKPLRHHEVLIALRGCVTDFDDEIREYFRRDLLNLAMGNRDNHGRNMAVLKDTDGSLRLAPIFDFGPSYLDARVIARSIHWDGERPGHINWNEVLKNLQTRFEDVELAFPQIRQIAEWLQTFAVSLGDLPVVMQECGVDADIIAQRAAPIEQLRRSLEEVKAP